MDLLQAVKKINFWFTKMVDGDWEHHNGLTLESSDNPGWILSIDMPDMSLTKSSKINDYIKKLPNIEGGLVDRKIRIFSSDLSAVITAAGLILNEVEPN